MITILLIDDEKDWLVSFKRTLSQNDITLSQNIYTAQTEKEALELLENGGIDIVFLDLMLGEISGRDVLAKLKQRYPELAVIIMTGVNDIHMALDCGKLGAVDYMVKTSLIEELIGNIKRIVKIRQLEQENSALKTGLFSHKKEFPAFKEFVTESPKMFAIFKYLTAISLSSYPILITGESGVGKGVLAKAAAFLSRPGAPFVPINVGGLDEQVFSDTLFGHKRGAFTGADANRMGAVQQAGSGTLFLDEIGDLSNACQLKLLYLAQDGEYQQLGADERLKSRAKFIFATNHNLEEKRESGEFRKDLYYRLNTHFVHIPPLRERKEDIGLLFGHFVSQTAKELNKPAPKFTDDIVELLYSFNFPGNVRELKAICFNLVAQTHGQITTRSMEACLKGQAETGAKDAPKRFLKLGEVMDKLIGEAMELANNNQTKAARMIGISQSTLSRRLRKHKI